MGTVGVKPQVMHSLTKAVTAFIDLMGRWLPDGVETLQGVTVTSSNGIMNRGWVV